MIAAFAFKAKMTPSKKSISSKPILDDHNRYYETHIDHYPFPCSPYLLNSVRISLFSFSTKDAVSNYLAPRSEVTKMEGVFTCLRLIALEKIFAETFFGQNPMLDLITIAGEEVIPFNFVTN